QAAPATRVAFGREHACAITRAGAVECSGKNDHGELGDGTLVDHPDGRAVAELVAPLPIPPEPVAVDHVRRATPWDHAPAECEHDAALAGTSIAGVSAWASKDAALIVLRDYPSGVS